MRAKSEYAHINVPTKLENDQMVATVNHVLRCAVSHRGSTYNFYVTAIPHVSTVTHNIPPSFYENDGMLVPSGAHYELLLGDSWVTRQTNSDTTLHVYQHPDGKRHFVCFTGQIETIEQAEAVFERWCLGTVYSLLQKKDFAPLFEEVPDPEEHLKTNFGIELV